MPPHTPSTSRSQRSQLHQRIDRCLGSDRAALRRQLKKATTASQWQVLTKHIVISEAHFKQRLAIEPVLKYPLPLPIANHKASIIEALQSKQVLIIAGDTGSGKTTQLPKFCLEAGFGRRGKIAVTQPRRVAALAIAETVRQDITNAGHAVSCKIRFSSDDHPHTLVKFVTDGMLLSEIRGDPDLYEYDCIIIDEAHERSLNIDFLLGYLHRLLEKRRDLKLIIASATLEQEALATLFKHATRIDVAGRCYPIELQYRPLKMTAAAKNIDKTITDHCIEVVREVASTTDGDILVFLATEYDIREVTRRLKGVKARILPLFSRLSRSEQQAIFQTGGSRKIVVATNIAETSVTIPGITVVIDMGLARTSRFSARTKTRQLPVEAIAQSSAKQRQGRCGRVAPGLCIRLYSEEDFNERDPFTSPEITRADLADVLLRMASLSLGDIASFPFITRPANKSVRAGLRTLQLLDAIDDKERITAQGKRMAGMGIDPRMACMILAGQREGVADDILTLAAASAIPGIFEIPFEREKEARAKHRQFYHPRSDFLTLLRVWYRLSESPSQGKMRSYCKTNFLSWRRVREWSALRDDLSGLVSERQSRKKSAAAASDWQTLDRNYDALHRAILCACIDNIACLGDNKTYRAAHDQSVSIFPGSTLASNLNERGSEARDKQEGRNGHAQQTNEKKVHAKWIVSAERIETSRVFARTCAIIDPQWIRSLAEHLCHYRLYDPHWDRKRGAVIAWRDISIFGLPLAKRESCLYAEKHGEAARKIFITDALVPGALTPPPPFISHNQEAIDRVLSTASKQRLDIAVVIADRLGHFYQQMLPRDIVNQRQLEHALRSNHALSQSLCTDDDFYNEFTVTHNGDAYPDHLTFQGRKLTIAYAMAEHDNVRIYSTASKNVEKTWDGACLRLPQEFLHDFPKAALDWQIPAWLDDKIIALLQSLPKQKRKVFLPYAASAQSIRNTERRIDEGLVALICRLHDLRETDFSWEQVPDHCRLHVAVCLNDEVIATDVNIDLLRQRYPRQTITATSRIPLAQKIDKATLLQHFPDQEIADHNASQNDNDAVAKLTYSGLINHEDHCYPWIFHDRKSRDANLRQNVFHLLRQGCHNEWASLAHALKSLDRGTRKSYRDRQWSQDLFEDLSLSINRSCDLETLLIFNAKDFQKALERQQRQLAQLSSQLPQILQEIPESYQRLRTVLGRHPNKALHGTFETHLQRLVFSDFVAATPLVLWPHLIRYFNALEKRMQRALDNPQADLNKQQQIVEFETQAATLTAPLPQFDRQRPFDDGIVSQQRQWQLQNNFLWHLEEFHISLFAQEVGTAMRISAKRLRQLWTQTNTEMR